MASGGKFNVALNEGHTPLAPDEPTFTFRAQDKFMPAILAFYAQLCEEEDASEEHIRSVAVVQDRTLTWQSINGCRVPD